VWKTTVRARSEKKQTHSANAVLLKKATNHTHHRISTALVVVVVAGRAGGEEVAAAAAATCFCKPWIVAACASHRSPSCCRSSFCGCLDAKAIVSV
jgi:hypothetical protein